MRYQIKDKHNFFIREDGDSSMVLFKEKHDQFILNGTGLVMFNLILENNQTQKVLEELKKIYENIEIAVLENDLQDIIRMLKMYGILVMEQEIEENVCKHTDISAVDENDLKKLDVLLKKTVVAIFLWLVEKVIILPLIFEHI